MEEEPTWPSWKPSVTRPGARHEAHRRGEARRGRAHLVEGRDDLEVEAAGVDLAHAAERGGKAEVLEDAAFQDGDLVGLAAEERQLVELRPDRALQPAHRIAGDQLLQPVEGDQQLLAEHRQALAEGRRLGGHVVGAAGDHQVAVLLGAPGEGEQRRRRLQPDDLQRLEDLQLLDVFREVAAGEAEVDELPLGQLGEFLDARLDVVEGGRARAWRWTRGRSGP